MNRSPEEEAHVTRCFQALDECRDWLRENGAGGYPTGILTGRLDARELLEKVERAIG